MDASAAMEVKVTRTAVFLMVGLAVTGVLLSTAGRSDVASVFALAELDVIWITLLTTGILLIRRGSPIAAGCAQIALALPPAPVRKAIGTEIGRIVSLARVLTRRPPRVPPQATPILAKHGTLATPLAFSAVTVIEVVVLHVFIPWPTLATILTLLSVYALILLFGVIAERWQHPHYLTATTLVLRNGAHVIVAIPRDRIDSAAVMRDSSATSLTVEQSVAKLANMNGCSVAIKLSSSQHVRLFASRRAVEHVITEVRLAVDDPRTLILELNSPQN
ncbi:MAG: hypothetical protein LH471_04170 [Salinibacterium sp.]|nr:hypothetical protein [Salinibacterium sp.]